MTVHTFPNKPIRNPNRELGISDIPLPPAYAVRDMEKAHVRFAAALSLGESGGLMSPSMVLSAQSDLRNHHMLTKYSEVDGIKVVSADDLIKFIHYVTGHPKAWIVSWQLHGYAASLEGSQVDRERVTKHLAERVRIASEIIRAGFNREL